MLTIVEAARLNYLGTPSESELIEHTFDQLATNLMFLEKRVRALEAAPVNGADSATPPLHAGAGRRRPAKSSPRCKARRRSS
jgi:hypothetical protein